MGITLVGVFNFYLIFKVAPHRLFEFLVKTLHVVVVIIGIQIIYHFIDNWSVPRTVPLLKETELLFGSRNVTAAFLSITMPFIISRVLKHAGPWRVMSWVTLFVSFIALFYVGARTAVLSATMICSLHILYFIIDGVRSGALVQRLKYPLLPIIDIVIVGFLLVTNSNRLDRSTASSYKNILTTSYRVNNGAAIIIESTQCVTSAKPSGHLLYYKMAMDDFKKSLLVDVGLGNWKLGNKDVYYSQSNTDRFLYPLRVHNDFLQILAETGILGFIPYVLLFIMLSGGILVLFFKKLRFRKKMDLPYTRLSTYGVWA